MKHKTEDYKISAVKYYLKNNDSFSKTCKVFDCKKVHYNNGLKDTRKQRIYLGVIENHFPTKLKKKGWNMKDYHQLGKIKKL